MNNIVEIQRLSSEGRGLAFTDRPCFVLGGLPGEHIEVKILRKYKGIFDAVAISEPTNPSADRVAPECQHFLQCGGCSFQHLSYPKQVSFKDQRARALWQDAGYHDVSWQDPITASAYNYRRKARISLRWVEKKQKLLLGFKEQDARKILDMSACAILTKGLQKHIFYLQDVISTFPEKKQIPQLELIEGDDGVAVIIRNLVTLSDTSLAALDEFSSKTLWQIWLQPKGYDSVHALTSTSGYLHYNLPKYDLKLAFKPLDFVQVNAKVNQKLVDLVIDWLDLQDSDQVLDLFCGLGNFSLPIAKMCEKVIGVEGSEEMVIRATNNANTAGLRSKLSFYAHDLRAISRNEFWANASFTKVLLDPPRSGAKACMTFLIEKQPQTIVYVSCNPESLVNDIKLLLDNGYIAEKACIADMFPQTKHIEQVVKFSKVS